jgi:hypothetical protein
MWAVLVALAVAGGRVPGRADARAQLRPALSHRQAQSLPPDLMRKTATPEDSIPLARMWSVLAPSGPVTVRPDFHGGPGAAIEFRF